MTVATAMAATISMLVLLALRCYVICDCNQSKRGKCSYGAGNEVDILYHKRTDCCSGEQNCDKRLSHFLQRKIFNTDIYDV